MNMPNRNLVFIAASLDGYIADKNGGLDWLQSIPNPGKTDMGYESFIQRIDALVMGRKTFETVCNFAIGWPYRQPVFVLSRTLKEIPAKYTGKAELVKGSITDIVKAINSRGYRQLYIDGGATIQNFLSADLIDELTITTIPVLLGGGTPLFSVLTRELEFRLVESKLFLGEIVQNHYERKR